MKRKLQLIGTALAVIVYAPGVLLAYAMALGLPATQDQVDAVGVLAIFGSFLVGAVFFSAGESKS